VDAHIGYHAISGTSDAEGFLVSMSYTGTLKAAVPVGLLLVATIGAAQSGRVGRGGYQRRAAYATPKDFDGGFQFCRLVFRQAGNGDGAGWNVDWPRADENLSIRLSELSRVPVSMEEGRSPKPLLVRLTDPGVVSRCPFIMMTEPGGAYFDDHEAANLKDYLLRGGFLWADDFWGQYAWDFWEDQLRKALPSAAFPIVEMPLDHPVFHQVFSVSSFPQIPGIGYWDGRNRTSERGPSTAVPHLRAINDDRGRVMVLMTFNTDFGDSYERETENPDYFQRFSVPGYAFGINVIVYAMTH
jgi:hypothetical protein